MPQNVGSKSITHDPLGGLATRQPSFGERHNTLATEQTSTAHGLIRRETPGVTPLQGHREVVLRERYTLVSAGRYPTELHQDLHMARSFIICTRRLSHRPAPGPKDVHRCGLITCAVRESVPPESGRARTPLGGATDRLAQVLTREIYDEMFRHRTDRVCAGAAFTFDALVPGANEWPSFAGDGSLTVRKRELAAFLANVAHETTGGWPTAPDGAQAWGLCFIEAACAARGCS
jgi:hypothetical protein